MSQIKVEGLRHVYSAGTPFERVAIDGISLTIEPGQLVGIIGHTGSGKSTFIQHLNALLQPTAGKVYCGGKDINADKYSRKAVKAQVGLVFQYPEYQLFETTVERDVAFGLRHSGLSREETAAAVKAALELVGFDYDAVRDKSPLGFSGGEKRRIAIAGVLASKPRVLILDEPVAGLDPLGRQDFLNMVDALNKDGVTIIMISHNADALAEHARRIIVLRDGALFRDGSAKEIFSDYFDLIHNGIGVPQVRRAAQLLRDMGVEMPGNIILYSQFIDRLKILMWRKNK